MARKKLDPTEALVKALKPAANRYKKAGMSASKAMHRAIDDEIADAKANLKAVQEEAKVPDTSLPARSVSARPKEQYETD